MNIRIEEMIALRHGPRTVQKVHLDVAVTRRSGREHRWVDERRAVRLGKHRRVPARAVVRARTVVGGAGAIIAVPAAHVRTATSGTVGRRAAGTRIGKVHRVTRRSRSGRRTAGRESAAVSEGRERDGRTRGLRRRIVAHPPALPHMHLDAVLSLGRVSAAGGRVVRRIQLRQQIRVIRPREVRQVDSGVTVCVAVAESTNQLALCRWHIPKAVAIIVRQTVVTVRRDDIEVVKRARVGVDRERGRNTSIRIAVGRRPAGSARARRGCLRGVDAAVSAAAAAAAASVMPGALANHVGFHRDWTGRTMQFETCNGISYKAQGRKGVP